MIVETDAERHSWRVNAQVLHRSATKTQTLNGKFMNKHVRSLVAIAFVLGLSGTAKAESQDGIIVTLPFKFVAGGKALPGA